jgi:hypothetical protein
MAKIQQPKKIRAEDFTGEEQQIITKISDPFNDLADSFYFALTKSLDFTNMNRDSVTVTVNIDGSGAVSNLPRVKFNLRTGSPQMVLCGRAQNIINPNIYPTNAPFISYTVINADTIQIQHVTGLPVNSQFLLTLELIG